MGYYLRRAVRGHGTDHVKAAMMLRDMYHKLGIPPTMLAKFKRELVCVCILAADSIDGINDGRILNALHDVTRRLACSA